MKIRNGFVSNSSTSSFIAVGFCIGDKPKEIPSKFERYLFKNSHHDEIFFLVPVMDFEYIEDMSLKYFEKNFNSAKIIVEKGLNFYKSNQKIKVYGSITDSSGKGGFSPYDPYEDENNEDDEGEEYEN